MNPRLKWVAGPVVAAAAWIFASGCATNSQPAPAQASISSKPWVAFQPIASVEEIQRLQPGDQIAMACAKCKSIVVTTKRQLTTKPSGGTVEEALTVHQCPGCGGMMTVRGDKQTHLVHTCSKCGDDSAFCCATTPGGTPTKGMEKK